MITYARQFIGKPYIWGGSGPQGFDCSGFVIEVLQAFNYLPSGDWSSSSLSTKLKSLGWKEIKEPNEGDVAFFGSPISHVAIMLNNFHYIECGGGGRESTTPENSKGMVRIRHTAWRKPSFYLRHP